MSHSNVIVLLFGVITLAACLSLPALSTNEHMNELSYRRVEDWQTGKSSVETKLVDELPFDIDVCALDAEHDIMYYSIYNHGKHTHELDAIYTKTGAIIAQKRLEHSLYSMEFDLISKQIYGIAFLGVEHPDKLMLVDPSTGKSRTVVDLPAGWRCAHNHGGGKYAALSQTNYGFIALGTRDEGRVYEWLNIDLKTKKIVTTKTNYTLESHPGNFIFNQTTNTLYGVIREGEEAIVVELDSRSGQVNRKIANIGERAVFTATIADNNLYLACQKPERQPTPAQFIAVALNSGTQLIGSFMSYVPICVRA